MDPIRAAADRVAASHGLEVVDLEFTGAGKARALRVYLEKDAAGREALKARAAEPESGFPSGVPVEALSGVTHEDCAVFAQDFGTLLDVEELVPGDAEYVLEASSPGIERRLYREADYQRFSGFLANVRLFQPVENQKVFTGRMTYADGTVTLDLSAVKQKAHRKGKKNAEEAPKMVSFPLANIEKANLVAEL